MIKTILRNWSSSKERPFTGYVPMLILAVLLGNASEVFAQKIMPAYNWSGNSVDNVLYKNGSKDASRSESDPRKVVFLQHVGTGKWLKPGGAWGTQLDLGDYATELWICKDKVNISGIWNRTYYFVNTSLGSESGSWIGYDVQSKDKSEWISYMDKAKGDNGIYIAWNFVDLGDGKYAISSRYPNGANTLSWNASPDKYYLCYDETTKSIVMKEVDNINYKTSGTDGDKRIGDPDVETLKKDPNLQWRIVSMQDIYDALDKTTSASIDEPFNLTFLIKDSGLDRNSYYNNKWDTNVTDGKGNGTGLKLGVENCYTSEVTNSTDIDRYGGPGEINKHGDAYKAILKEYGKYFCGEARQSDGRYFSQTITVPRAGWYRVSCQGFNDEGAQESCLYATVGNSNYAYKKLASIDNFEGDGTAPTNLTEAGKMFYNKQYYNCLYIHADQAGQGLALGLKFKGNGWTAFDDFELAYCGKDNPELVLDETQTDLDHIKNAHSDYNDFKGAILYLHRKMDANKWNTFVAPVDLNMGQVRDLFGNHTQVAELDYYNDGYMRFKRVENDEETGDAAVVMKANNPYIVMPTQSEGTGGYDEDGKAQDKTVQYRSDSQTQAEGNEPEIKVTCKAPYASTFVTTKVDKTKMEDADNLMGGAQVTSNDLTFHGTLVKTFGTNTETSEKEYNLNLSGSYIIYGGKLYYVNRQYGLNGLKGYFTLKKKEGTTQNLSKIHLDIDGVEDEDEVTGIDQIFGGDVLDKQNANVYSLDGQLVSTNGSTDNLPKGVYIVNGKKQVVK